MGRPRIWCNKLKMSFLVDSGAAVSIIPRSRVKEVTGTSNFDNVKLRAVNGSEIQTYGKRTFRLQMGRAHFTHTFVIADLPGVLGVDWMSRHGIRLTWTDGKCKLSAGRRTIPVTMGRPSSELLGLQLAEVDFKTYSAAHKVTEGGKEDDIPPVYEKMLAKYPNIDKPDFRKKPAHGVVHHINTENHPPCRAKVRRLLPGTPKEVLGKKKWMKMEAEGVITRIKRHEVTTWSTALHLAPKTDGEIRACGDFRPLNSKTVLDTQPLPNILTFQDQLKGAKVFSTIDLKSAYYQIELDRPSSFKTVTLTPWGPYRYLRLPMGLKNSGPTFQRMLEAVLQGLEGLFIYLDDVLVWAKDERQHQKRVDALLQRLHENGLAIARDKCQFSKPELTFLGYTVSAQGIVPLQRKVETITAFPPPQKAKSLLGFLGAINYYRRCLPNLGRQTAAEVLQPLYTAATQKQPGKSFKKIWEEQELDVHFKKAKELLVMACQLTHPDPNAPLALVADASGKAAGAALEQLTGGVWRPLGFWSRH